MGSIPITRSIIFAGVAKLADARDLKSRDWRQSYRFDSGPRHHVWQRAGIAQGVSEKFTGGCGEMADALASGASDGNIMVVRVHSAAPLIISYFYAVVAELADALL